MASIHLLLLLLPASSGSPAPRHSNMVMLSRSLHCSPAIPERSLWSQTGACQPNFPSYQPCDLNPPVPLFPHPLFSCPLEVPGGNFVSSNNIHIPGELIRSPFFRPYHLKKISTFTLREGHSMLKSQKLRFRESACLAQGHPASRPPGASLPAVGSLQL